jgi:hypothetical protein
VNYELLAAAGTGFVLGVIAGIGLMLYLVLSSHSAAIRTCKQPPRSK